MNHHQRKVLQAIFAHPVNANLDLKDVTGVLTGLGAEIDTKTKSRIGVTLNGQTTFLHLTHHSLLKAEVMQIRKFLEVRAGFPQAPIRSRAAPRRAGRALSRERRSARLGGRAAPEAAASAQRRE